MIEVQDDRGTTVKLIVTANRSMSWKANLYLAASLGLICMGVAVAMAMYGLWMVIPFAGLEIVFIVACLYLTLKRLSRQEVITIDNEAITLEWGYSRPDVRVDLPRRWSRLTYRCKDSMFEVGELSVAAHGRRYALGGCLNREEKKALYGELQTALAR